MIDRTTNFNISNKNNLLFDLKNQIKNSRIPENDILASLDVVSGYTNKPTDLARTIILQKLDLIKKYTDISLNEFLNATGLTLNSPYFLYKTSITNKYRDVQWGLSHQV